MSETKNKVSLFPILLISFVGTLGFSIVLPFLVFLVEKFGGNALSYGILGAVYPAFQLIGSPVLGKWSDIYGRKKILFLSEIGTLLGWLVFLIAFFVVITKVVDLTTSLYGSLIITLPLLIIFIARAIDGITGGNISVANAYLADISAANERNKNYGKMSVATNIGFIAGPAVAGLLASTVLGEMLPVIFACAISLFATLLIRFYLPDSKVKTEQSGVQNISLNKVWKLEFVPFLLVLYFLIFLGFNFFYTSFPIHVVSKLKWSVTEMGIFFAVLSGMMALVQGPLLSYASKKFSDSILIIIGSLFLGANFIMLYFDNRIIIYSAAILFALGNGLMWPSFLSLLSKAAGDKYQGSVQGFAGSMGAVASIIGLIAGGILYEKLSSFTFIISAAIIYIVFFVSLRLPKIENTCKLKNAK